MTFVIGKQYFRKCNIKIKCVLKKLFENNPNYLSSFYECMYSCISISVSNQNIYKVLMVHVHLSG